MRNGYVICGLSHGSGYVQRAADGLPPPSVKTTDWSLPPSINERYDFHFLLRVPGDASGLYRAVEEVLDAAGVYREGCDGLTNHRLLLAAIGKIRRCTARYVHIEFTLSPEQIRLRDLEFFQTEAAADWGGYTRCLEDPGCAEVLRRGC
jgi:hypothetical protein